MARSYLTIRHRAPCFKLFADCQELMKQRKNTFIVSIPEFLTSVRRIRQRPFHSEVGSKRSVFSPNSAFCPQKTKITCLLNEKRSQTNFQQRNLLKSFLKDKLGDYVMINSYIELLTYLLYLDG